MSLWAGGQCGMQLGTFLGFHIECSPERYIQEMMKISDWGTRLRFQTGSGCLHPHFPSFLQCRNEQPIPRCCAPKRPQTSPSRGPGQPSQGPHRFSRRKKRESWKASENLPTYVRIGCRAADHRLWTMGGIKTRRIRARHTVTEEKVWGESCGNNLEPVKPREGGGIELEAAVGEQHRQLLVLWRAVPDIVSVTRNFLTFKRNQGWIYS